MLNACREIRGICRLPRTALEGQARPRGQTGRLCRVLAATAEQSPSSHSLQADLPILLTLVWSLIIRPRPADVYAISCNEMMIYCLGWMRECGKQLNFPSPPRGDRKHLQLQAAARRGLRELAWPRRGPLPACRCARGSCTAGSSGEVGAWVRGVLRAGGFLGLTPAPVPV